MLKLETQKAHIKQIIRDLRAGKGLNSLEGTGGKSLEGLSRVLWALTKGSRYSAEGLGGCGNWGEPLFGEVEGATCPDPNDGVERKGGKVRGESVGTLAVRERVGVGFLTSFNFLGGVFWGGF